MSADIDQVSGGAAVRLARDVMFSGRTFAAGELAVVQSVFAYPAGVVEGDRIYEARVVEGAYSDGSPALGIAVPLVAADVRAAPPPAPSGSTEEGTR